jgi:hypothetical protein
VLGYDTATTVNDPPAARAPAGLVLFTDTNTDAAKHVVLGVGQDRDGVPQMMSIWTFETGGTFDRARVSLVSEFRGPEQLVALKRAAPF